MDPSVYHNIETAFIMQAVDEVLGAIGWRFKLMLFINFISSFLLALAYSRFRQFHFLRNYTQEILMFNFISSSWLFGVFILNV